MEKRPVIITRTSFIEQLQKFSSCLSKFESFKQIDHWLIYLDVHECIYLFCLLSMDERRQICTCVYA